MTASPCLLNEIVKVLTRVTGHMQSGLKGLESQIRNLVEILPYQDLVPRSIKLPCSVSMSKEMLVPFWILQAGLEPQHDQHKQTASSEILMVPEGP